MTADQEERQVAALEAIASALQLLANPVVSLDTGPIGPAVASTEASAPSSTDPVILTGRTGTVAVTGDTAAMGMRVL